MAIGPAFAIITNNYMASYINFRSNQDPILKSVGLNVSIIDDLILISNMYKNIRFPRNYNV